MAQNTTTLNHTKDIALSDSSRTRFFPMLNIVASNHFKKDLKLAAKRGFDLDLLESVVDILSTKKGLTPKYYLLGAVGVSPVPSPPFAL